MSEALDTVDPTPTDWNDRGDAAAHPQALRGRAALPAGRARRGLLSAGFLAFLLITMMANGLAASPRPRSGSTSARRKRRRSRRAISRPRWPKGSIPKAAWLRLRDSGVRQGQVWLPPRPRSTSPPRATAGPKRSGLPAARPRRPGADPGQLGLPDRRRRDRPDAGRHLGRVQGLASDDDRDAR